VAFAASPLGPFERVSDPISGPFSEGPSVVKVGAEWLIYYDAYREKTYKALRTSDFQTFEAVNDEIAIPQGHKHGTIFKTNNRLLKRLLQSYGQKE
jgi:hypothetical protein